MLFSLLLLPLLSQCLNTKVQCIRDPLTNACDHLTIYFNPTNPIRINSIIKLELPFTIQGEEELILSSFDESTIGLLTLKGNTHFTVSQILPENIWYKCNLTLSTVLSKKQKGIGQFQMNIVASQHSNTLILEQGPQIPLTYSVINQIYSPPSITPIATVIPSSSGTLCLISDWGFTLNKNLVRQQQSMTFTLSYDATNDRLDVILTIDSLNSAFIIHRECYFQGPDVAKFSTDCTLKQTGSKLTFQLRSQDPVLLKQQTEYLLEFFISHQGDTITASTFTAEIYHDTQLIDQCQSSKTFLIDETDLPVTLNQITEVELYLDTPNIGVPTFMGISFRPKNIQIDTLIRIELGFLSYESLNCKVFQLEIDQFMPSLSFSHYSYDSQNLYFYSNKNKPDQVQYKYSINCTGITILQTTNKIFRVLYEDLFHTIIQYYQTRQPPKLPTDSSTQQSASLKIVKSIELLSKKFNNPLVSSIITFKIVPTYGIYRVLIEFPSSYTTNIIKCVLNETSSVFCTQDSLNPNRIIIYLTKYHDSELIKDQFNITVYGMINPFELNYNSKICIMLDDDNILTPLQFGNENNLNGITQYEYIEDYINPSIYKQLPTSDFRFSQSFARMYDVFLIGNITFSMESINERNKLYLRISDQYTIYDLNCQLIKLGDLQLNNYISSCNSNQNYIEMELITDTGNNRFSQQYYLNISKFRTQDLISIEQYGVLQPMIQLFLARDDSIISLENQVNGSFVMKTFKIPFYWYSRDAEGEYKRLEVQQGFEDIKTYKIYLNHFGLERLYLGLGDVTDRFNCTINLQLPTIPEDIIVFGQSSKYAKQSFSSQTITQPKYIVKSMTDDVFYETIKDTELMINPGDSGFIFNIASKSLVNIKIRVQINYTISFPSRNSWNPIYYYYPYTEIPVLYLEIVHKGCELIPQKSSYDLPVNGYTHPIIIDASECIPIVDTQLNVTIQDNNKLQLVPIQMSISRYRFELIKRTTRRPPEFSYIFQIKATNLTVAGIITQVLINNIAISISAILEYKDKPTANPLKGLYSQTSNSISLSMTCSQPSEILLVIGIDEITDESFEKIKSNSISNELTEQYDLFKLQPENATLQQDSNYISKYDILPISLIMDIYNNRIGNQITYNDYDIANQVNQSLIKDSSYKTLMNSIRRMMINRLSLLEKTSQLYLQRIQSKFNFFDSTISFTLSNLKFNTKYSFGYYCKNLNGNTSDISTNFQYISNETSINNKTVSKMLQLKFKSKISSLQENNILCALAQYLSINYYQVLSRECKQCRFANIHYDKINYTQYLQLVQDFIPYENRSSTDKQKYIDNLYTMKIYFNNYPSSNGQNFDITQKIDKSLNLTNETILNIINVTDDFQLIFNYETFTYQELKPIKKSNVELATQLVLLNYEFKTISMDITIKANQDVLGIVGLHKIEPIFENVIKHPTGIMLRRGILSTFNNISEGVQFAELAKNENTTLTFKNLIDGQKYIIYYSSTDLQNDCLTKQYQETVVQQITFISQLQSQEFKMHINIALMLFVIFCII
ncbi:unnamed protein product [Paramecium sonneborni]|uniref:Uncharacterized protein n=1 Tax=Paramecium sonneborni TaxID=65129 RepID=A0A8S1MNR6_9CILI|nr:unnamed protein product [Paramecium sonneborni]